MAAKILVAYSTSEGQTARVAEYIAEVLREDGCTAEVADLRRTEPDVRGFDGVLIGGSAHAGKFQKELGRFVEENVSALNAMPAWLFSVSLSEAFERPPFGHEHAMEQIAAFLGPTGWTPTGTASFAGALKYRDYSWPKRMGMRQIMHNTGGETDTSRNWQYTDWKVVRAFAVEVANAVHREVGSQASIA